MTPNLTLVTDIATQPRSSLLLTWYAICVVIIIRAVTCQTLGMFQSWCEKDTSMNEFNPLDKGIQILTTRDYLPGHK